MATNHFAKQEAGDVLIARSPRGGNHIAWKMAKSIVIAYNWVDLTINGAADRIAELSIILKWLHENGNDHITLEKTSKSAAFRIYTPEIKMNRPFSQWKMGDLNACFDAIQELADLAAMFVVMNKVVFAK